MRAVIFMIHEFEFETEYVGGIYMPRTAVGGDIVHSDEAGIRIRDEKTQQLWWIPNTNVKIVKVLEDDDE